MKTTTRHPPMAHPVSIAAKTNRASKDFLAELRRQYLADERSIPTMTTTELERRIGTLQ